MLLDNLETLTTLFTILVIVYYTFKYPNVLVVIIMAISLITINRNSNPDNTLLFILSRLNLGLLAYLIIDYLKTKKKQALMMADTHWAAVLEGSLYGIVGVDLNGRIEHWNQTAQSIFGWRENEVKGRSIKMIMPPDRMDEYRDIMDKIQHGERMEMYNNVRLNSHGKTVKVDTTVSPVRDPATKKLLGATAIVRRVQ